MKRVYDDRKELLHKFGLFINRDEFPSMNRSAKGGQEKSNNEIIVQVLKNKKLNTSKSQIV